MRSKWWQQRIIVALAAVCGALAWATPLAAQQMAWTRWELAPPLTAQLSYNNAYKNVQLQVAWTCLSNCDQNAASAQMTRFGYWDGGSTFKIRASFPQPTNGAATSSWRWTTSCVRTTGSSDTNCAGDNGLINKTGTVTVSRSDSSTNPLYRGGALTVRELNYADGNGNVHFYNDLGPFYWQGDTAWNAPIRARFNATTTPDCSAAGWSNHDWKCYIADRLAKGFTAVQISVPQDGMASPLKDTANQQPFTGTTDWNQVNPVFWQNFADKIQYANQQGLVVLLVGVMEPAYANGAPRYPPQADAVNFARHIAARLGGNFVIFSPGFDTRPDTLAKRNLIRAVGEQLHAVSPRPIITNHFGGQTAVGAPDSVFDDYADFNGEVWLDTNMFQSGQARTQRADPAAQLQTVTQRARQMPRDLRNLSPRKGSANIESIYDYDGLTLTGATPVWAGNYTAFRVRHTAYLSTLSGGFGYTMGVAGIYDWGLGVGPEYQPRTPQNSVGSVSATHVQRLGSLFRAHRWESLMPVDIVTNNPALTGNQHLQMVASRDLTRRSTLAYLPDNNTITLSLNTTIYPDFANALRWQKQWYNPRTGGRQGATPSGTAPNFTFTRPSVSGDWVLELIDLGIGGLRYAGGPGLQSWASFDDASQTWSITGQLVDKQGGAIGDAFAISDAEAGLQRLPVVTRANADSAFVVVWEAERGILARRVRANGELLGAVQRVSGPAAGRRFDPVVTSDASGGIVVAWTEADAGATRIVSRRFSGELAPLGDELVVSAGRDVNRRSPLVRADDAGNFVVAWQQYDPIARLSSIATRRFDANGNASSEQLIESSERYALALERLDVDAAGNLRVLWQQLDHGQSRGHYSRTLDRQHRPAGRRVLEASDNE